MDGCGATPERGGSFPWNMSTQALLESHRSAHGQEAAKHQVHDCLHRFLLGWGTGTSTTEVKLTEKLAYLEQAPLYGIFIDLQKAYDAMDMERCMEIMRGCGVGPNLRRLIQFFWNNLELVCRASRVFGKPFKARQ